MMTPEHHDVAVLGTGFAGLGMAAQLRRRGARDFIVFERAAEVGGTWRDNTYPGCACDVKSDLYSFSFAPNPHWARRYARQPEILAYLRGVAEREGLLPHIRFSHELTGADWDEAEGLWRLRAGGRDFTARVLLSGHGPLVEPRWPDLPGLDTFRGARFHSARWDHSAELAGRRVAVIGTGASAVQFVPELQKIAGQLTVFQRTPPWVMPRLDHETSARRRTLFRRYPLLQRLQRQWLFGVAEARFASFTSERARQLTERLGREHLAEQVADPALRAKLTPDYRAGCKRILVSDDYYPALTQPNTELVPERLVRVDGNALVTADGARREFDVLVCGTGFNATRPRVARLIRGRGGVSLADAWAHHMEALHGTMVAGFPNLFLIVGPNTALGHNSIVYIAEAQIEYILAALARMDEQGLSAIEPSPEAQEAYNGTLQARLARSVWVTGGCTSYYLDEHGRNSTLWPGRASAFRQQLRRFDPSLYRERLSPRRPDPLLGRSLATTGAV